MPQVYDELRRLAGHRVNQQGPQQTISGTALVHEVYLRLSKEGEGPRWVNRKQFFSAAAEAMRRILIDRIRAKRRIKRGGAMQQVTLDEAQFEFPGEEAELLQIDEALESFEEVDAECANLVKLRFFVGLTLEEIAESMNISVRTVSRQLAYARGWLAQEIT